MLQLLILLFISQVCSVDASYEDFLAKMWVKTANAYSADGFLPQNIRRYLKQKADAVQVGERFVVAFYPTKSTFDELVLDRSLFVSHDEFVLLSQEFSLHIVSYLPQKHLAEFASHDALRSFVKKWWLTDLKPGDLPLHFPSKIVFAELEKF